MLLASRDRAFAKSLADCLAGRAVEVAFFRPEPGATPATATLAANDVLLVEVHGLSGEDWDLLVRLREAAPLAEVIAISSEPRLEEAVEALLAGVFAVLEYPVSSDQLAEEIARAGQRKRRGEARLRQLDGAAAGAKR